jgi:hypothetical protein
MASTLPYLASPGSLTKALEKIKTAATPERVTFDFISTVIGVKGGGGRSLIPFLKRSGLVKTDAGAQCDCVAGDSSPEYFRSS